MILQHKAKINFFFKTKFVQLHASRLWIDFFPKKFLFGDFWPHCAIASLRSFTYHRMIVFKMSRICREFFSIIFHEICNEMIFDVVFFFSDKKNQKTRPKFAKINPNSKTWFRLSFNRIFTTLHIPKIKCLGRR